MGYGFCAMTGGGEKYDDLKLHLHVLGEDHEIDTRARVGPTRLGELLPLARSISEGVSAIAVAHEAREGRTVSCRAGCGACCCQVVPIAPLEAARLATVVEAMPEERRREVNGRFADAIRRLERAGVIDPKRRRGVAALRSTKKDPKEAWEDASGRYFKAGVPCPFLVDQSCSIYEERPMVCREFLVTTPAERCATWGADVRDVPRPARMSEALTDATNAILGRRDPNLPLVLALEWAAAHRGALDREGDGEELAMTLVRQIQESSDAEPG